MLVCDQLDLERTQREADGLASRGAVVDIHVGDADAFAKALDQLDERWAGRTGDQEQIDPASQEMQARTWLIIGEALDYAFATGRINKSIAAVLNIHLQNALRGRPPKAWAPGWKSMHHDAAYAVGTALNVLDIARARHVRGVGVRKMICETFGVPEDRIKEWRKLRRNGRLAVAIGDYQLAEMAVAAGVDQMRSLLADRGRLYRKHMPQTGGGN